MAFRFLLLVALWCGSAATAAELSAQARAEIDHLLAYLAQSGCRFERNGKWYDADKGRAHMERKLSWLLRRELVTSAEEFIERAASHSSRSGDAYRVQCGDAEPVTSAAWFSAELKRLREEPSRSHLIEEEWSLTEPRLGASWERNLHKAATALTRGVQSPER